MRRVMLLVALAVGLVAGDGVPVPEMPEFVGNLTSELHQSAPVGLAGGGRVTIRLINTSGGVMGMERITAPDASYPAGLRLLAAADGELDEAIWGPPAGAELSALRNGLTASQHLGPWRVHPGEPAYRRRLELRESRPPLVLLPREGYAWTIDFAGTWLSEDSAQLARGKRQLVLHASGGVFTMLLPAKDGGAVVAGRPVRWDERRASVTVPKRRAVAIVAGPVKAPAPPAAQASGAVLLIQADAEAQVGLDLPVTYLVGNLSAEPLWVWQNRMTPAWPHWRVLDRQEREVGRADGALAMPLQRLLPERAPFPLLPGEFLCWKHLIPAGALAGLRAGQPYVLHGSLEAPLASGWNAPADGTAATLTATLELVPRPAGR